MKKRTIIRRAFLEDYQGQPEALIPLVAEARAKGYRGIVARGRSDDIASLRPLAAETMRLGMELCIFTGFMKYETRYIAAHPEQRVVQEQAGGELKAIGVGCPFQPAFKGRYLTFLRRLAALAGVGEIWINDESHLMGGCYCALCREIYRREFGGEMPRLSQARDESWRAPDWRRFVAWRIRRWNSVHAEMAGIIHQINPSVKAVFQSSPSMDLSGAAPWYTSVDLSGMVEELDGLCTDPYYTAHGSLFKPAEVYLSEWSRFVAGIVPDGKRAEICPQGFSHPTFTRPLEARDGLWTAIIPVSCGIDYVSPYTYPLMKCAAPQLRAYERCFAFDPLFEQARPLSYAAIVHGSATETFGRPFAPRGADSYDSLVTLPCTDSLRHQGIPYSYLPDCRLLKRELRRYQVVVLPDLVCLGRAARRALADYWRTGGNLVILGQCGLLDAAGAPARNSLLEELFGIHIAAETMETRTVSFAGRHPMLDGIPLLDADAARSYAGGALAPLAALNRCFDVIPGPGAQIVAVFADTGDKRSAGPAVLVPRSPRGAGRVVYLAGLPSRVALRREYNTTVRNIAHWLPAAAARWASGRPPALAVEDWPPRVPVEEVRPLDTRYTNTYEFFPLIGRNLELAVIASYFREPASFGVSAELPAGKKFRQVRELISRETVTWRIRSGRAIVPLCFTEEDALKILAFELESA